MKRMLLALNFALLIAVFGAYSSEAAAAEGFKDCCQFSSEGDIFCCVNCCWFTTNCHDSEDCLIIN